FQSLRELNSPHPPPSYNSNVTYLYPRANGVPMHLRTSFEMPDVGHAEYSQWSFAAYTVSNGTYWAKEQTDSRGLAWGPVHLRIVLHKGILPYEPPHPDFWQGAVTVP